MVSAPGRGWVVTVGEPLVAFVASDGPLPASAAYTSVVTGAETNVAIALARLGHDVELLGQVGADAIGERVLRTLRAEQVGSTFVRSVPGADTGVLIREPAVFGPAQVLYRRRGSAGSLMDASYVATCSAAFQGASWLHVTGITPALSTSCAQAVRHAVDLARSNGVKVSLDVNMRVTLWDPDTAHATLHDLVPLCDLVFGDAAELCLLAGVPSLHHAIELLHEMGVSQVVLKRGALGAVVHSSASPALELPGVPVNDVKDLVGAGDAFVAGYLSARLDFDNGVEAGAAQPDLGRGCLVAAFAVSAVGDSTAAPTRERITTVSADIVR